MKFPKRLATCLGIAALVLTATGCEQVRVDAEVRELCAKDGGIKVYETVALSADDYAKYSKTNWRGLPLKNKLREADEYYWDMEYLYHHRNASGDPTSLDMFRIRSTVVRRSDNKILGEDVTYMRRGGDFLGGLGSHPSSFVCPSLPHSPDDPQLFTSVFLKAK